VPSDAPTIDYRQLLEEERRQLQSELSELGFGESGGLDYDPNFADSRQVTAARGEAGVEPRQPVKRQPYNRSDITMLKFSLAKMLWLLSLLFGVLAIVPAYAATESFNYLRAKYPEYSYKEATLNPTNPRDRPADWESDIIRYFRDNPNIKRKVASRETVNGTSWYLAQPLVAGPPCLECHSTAAAAPPAMVAMYGSNNGFGWQLNEVVGAQIVSVPASLPVRMADSAFRNLLFDMCLVALITLIAVDLALIMIVVRPVSQLSAMADRISRGELDDAQLPIHGKDEIAGLAGSFDRMRISMAKAMKMLEGE